VSFLPVLTVGYFVAGAVERGERRFRKPLPPSALGVLERFTVVPMQLTPDFVDVRWLYEGTPARQRELIEALRRETDCEFADLGHRHFVEFK